MFEFCILHFYSVCKTLARAQVELRELLPTGFYIPIDDNFVIGSYMYSGGWTEQAEIIRAS